MNEYLITFKRGAVVDYAIVIIRLLRLLCHLDLRSAKDIVWPYKAKGQALTVRVSAAQLAHFTSHLLARAQARGVGLDNAGYFTIQSIEPVPAETAVNLVKLGLSEVEAPTTDFY